MKYMSTAVFVCDGNFGCFGFVSSRLYSTALYTEQIVTILSDHCLSDHKLTVVT